ITDRIVCTGQIIVDRSGNTHRRDVEFLVKFVQTGKCTGATDGDQPVDTQFCQVVKSFTTALRRPELFTARGLQHGAPPLQNITDGPGTEFHDVPIDHAFVSTHDSITLFLIVGTGTYHGTDGGVHSWRISTR